MHSDDSIFTDADEDPAPQQGGRRKRERQKSMREMLPGFSDRDPKKGRRTGPVAGSGELSEQALEQISALIASGNAQLMQHLDRKWEAIERRCEVLENALFDERKETETVKRRLSKIEQENRSLREQLESLDINHRLDSLILKCAEFGARELGEDIEAKTIDILTSKLPGLRMSEHDIQAVHRLAPDNTVICKFFKRQLRDDIYENRFRQEVKDPRRRLYITESLSAQNKEIMNALVQAKKRRQVYAVFSRRGHVFVKVSQDKGARRVDSMEHAERLMSARRADVPGAGEPAGGIAVPVRPGAQSVPGPPPRGGAPAGSGAPGGSGVPGRPAAPPTGDGGRGSGGLVGRRSPSPLRSVWRDSRETEDRPERPRDVSRPAEGAGAPGWTDERGDSGPAPAAVSRGPGDRSGPPAGIDAGDSAGVAAPAVAPPVSLTVGGSAAVAASGAAASAAAPHTRVEGAS